jgi:hypothetical protein
MWNWESGCRSQIFWVSYKKQWILLIPVNRFCQMNSCLHFVPRCFFLDLPYLLISFLSPLVSGHLPAWVTLFSLMTVERRQIKLKWFPFLPTYLLYLYRKSSIIQTFSLIYIFVLILHICFG